MIERHSSGRVPRVAIFTETFLPRVDGIVNTLKWALRGLVEAGWEPMVVAPAGNTGSFPGTQVIGAPSVVFPLYPEVRLGFATPAVWRELDRFAPDLVHLTGPVTNGLGGLRYAQARGLPIVSSYHTALPDYARLYGLGWLVDWAWNALRDIHNATAVTLCPSRPTIEDLERRGFERLALWARGVDTSLFTPEGGSTVWRARLGVSDSDVVVVYVGRLAREKKLGRLAAAVRRLRDVHVALVGDGPDRARLEREFSDVPATFTGILRGADLVAAYASSDIFAFPSDTDTFGNVVLEAMACGLPVVATTVGGQMDLVSPGLTGLLFEPDDVAQFARHLERYRDDPALRARHGAEGLHTARERGWQRQQQVLIQHYMAAIERGTLARVA